MLVAGVCVRLGMWQLDRLEQRRARNALQSAALAMPALRLEGDSLRAVLREPDRYRYRRVTLRGSFHPGADLVLRGRALDGRPGVQVLTPFQLEGGATVLVNRGWVPSSDASTVELAPLREPGLREIDGLLQPVPRVDGDTRALVRERAGRRTLSVQRLDIGEARDSLGLPLLPVYMHQLPRPGDPPAPSRLPLPQVTGEGPHLGYAIQWFSFAAIAVGGVLILLLRGRKS